MESGLDPREELRAAERAAAAPYVEYPSTPWFPLVAGVWATALVAVLATVNSDRPWMVVLLIALVALEGAFLGWYRRQRGTSPTLRQVPPEFRRVFLAYGVGAVTVTLLIAACVVWAPLAVALVITFVLVTAGMGAYERLYAAAAAASRRRLS